MEPTKDIYHKDDAPFLFRRKKRRRNDQDGSSGRSSGTYGYGDGISPIDGRSQIQGRRRDRRYPYSVPPIFWVLTFLVVGVYGVALVGVRILRPFKAKPAASSPSNPATNMVVRKDDIDLAKTVNDRIKAWNIAGREVESAITSTKDGKYDKAAQSLQKALVLSPGHQEARLELARLLIREKKFADARAALVDAVSADPTDPAARRLMAVALLGEKSYPAAVASAKWCLDLDRYDSEAHQIAADAYMAMEQYGSAVDHLRKLMNINSDNLSVYSQMADAYSRMGNHGEAIQVLLKVIERDPRNSAGFYTLAVCYARKGQPNDALDVLGKAAGVFGTSFVSTWTQAREFDAIRTNSLFVAFQDQLSRGILPADEAPVADLPVPEEQPAVTPGT